MIIDTMIKYLRARGFNVSVTKENAAQIYLFSISKGITRIHKTFIIPLWLGQNTTELYKQANDWLEYVIEEFHRTHYNNTRTPSPVEEYVHSLSDKKQSEAVNYCSNDCKITAALAKEFMNEMDKISNSSELKLVGDLTSGYTYLPESFAKDVREYVTEQLKNEIMNMKGTENMATFANLAVAFGTKTDSAKYVKDYLHMGIFTIEKVIFNDPATIVFWKDGTKTVVKASNEVYDPEKGLAMAIAKKAYGNQGNYFNKIKKWTGEPCPIPTVKDDDFRDFVESALSCLANRFIKSRTKEFLLEDIRTAKKYLSMVIDIYRRLRCSIVIPYDIEIAAKALDDAVYDTKRTKATLVVGMDKAAYILQTLVQD